MTEKDWQAEIDRLREREQKARAILGVSETADATEIRRAFRRASLVHHPDVNREDQTAGDRFRLIRCAYEFLTKGEPCEDLDRLDIPVDRHTQEKYRMDHPWGYWCWWREQYFGPTDST